MDVDVDNKTNVNDSVGKDPDENNVREEVGPDI